MCISTQKEVSEKTIVVTMDKRVLTHFWKAVEGCPGKLTLKKMHSVVYPIYYEGVLQSIDLVTKLSKDNLSEDNIKGAFEELKEAAIKKYFPRVKADQRQWYKDFLHSSYIIGLEILLEIKENKIVS